jgi:hypothetical protein
MLVACAGVEKVAVGAGFAGAIYPPEPPPHADSTALQAVAAIAATFEYRLLMIPSQIWMFTGEFRRQPERFVLRAIGLLPARAPRPAAARSHGGDPDHYRAYRRRNQPGPVNPVAYMQ